VKRESIAINSKIPFFDFKIASRKLQLPEMNLQLAEMKIKITVFDLHFGEPDLGFAEFDLQLTGLKIKLPEMNLQFTEPDLTKGRFKSQFAKFDMLCGSIELKISSTGFHESKKKRIG
jgi:hypothetical protein